MSTDGRFTCDCGETYIRGADNAATFDEFACPCQRPVIDHGEPATLGDTLAFFAVITACCLGWLLAMWAAWHGLT